MQQFVDQLDEVISRFAQRCPTGATEASARVAFGLVDATSIVVEAQAAIARAAGANSVYYKSATEFGPNVVSEYYKLPRVIASALALRKAIASGWMQTHTELVHAELFGSFVEMAEHLIGVGYKDAAAVIIGSSLEAHIRELCKKNSIAISDGDGKPIKANVLVAELKKASVFNELVHKQLLAWQDLRNKAAHGDFAAYSVEAVRMMIQGVTDFMTRHPA